MNGLAFRLVMLGEPWVTLISVLVFLIGFFTALWFKRPGIRPMHRAEYVFVLALLYFVPRVTSAGWLLSEVAIVNGVYAALTFAIFFMVAVVGFFNGRAAQARSVSAYGDTGHAWMAVVPFANLALAFGEPQERFSQEKSVSNLGTNTYVVLGFAIFIVLRLIATEIENRIDTQVAEMVPSPEFQAASFDIQVEAYGLQKVLHDMAAGSAPTQIDETTLLKGVQSQNDRLIYTYVLDGTTIDTASVDEAVGKALCDDPSMRIWMKAGATVVFRYETTEGEAMAEVSRSYDQCETI
jgi:hypothetical protein